MPAMPRFLAEGIVSVGKRLKTLFFGSTRQSLRKSTGRRGNSKRVGAHQTPRSRRRHTEKMAGGSPASGIAPPLSNVKVFPVMKLLPLLSLGIAGLASSLYAADFVPLFNGKDLEGWEQHSGKAEYRVEDGTIVGKTVANTGNSFLCSKKTYGDFVLEFEFKVAPGMNSGVQFRSEFFDKETEVPAGDGKTRKIPADRVFGYQYEIDPSARAYTGGIYDEARRAWLFDLKDNEAARKAFKQGDWNHARIECKGDQIVTWINEVKAADLKDGLTLRGIIGLQVHGIGKKEPGEEIRWRAIRIKEL
jgi:hypothetical protein